MDYFKFQITTDAATAEVVMALLADLPFDTFQETETGLDAYLPQGEMTPGIEAYLDELKEAYGFTFEKEFIAGQNWNEIWETNFHPIAVGSFCGIRADFHPPFEQVQIELVINPKMAFGTGHHETTFMMVEWMETLPLAGAKVLDYGCGTGVLAILASRLGASAIDAVDIEEESFLNTVENSKINGVTNVQAFHGTLEAVPGPAYDIILANINRNVILESIDTLEELMKPDAVLVVSGFLKQDEDLMKNAFSFYSLQVVDVQRKNDWISMVVRKE